MPPDLIIPRGIENKTAIGVFAIWKEVSGPGADRFKTW